VAGGLLLFGALVRIVGFLQNASLIGDEAMLALSIGGRSFSGLLQPLDYGQVATVPFLWAERLVTLAGGVSGYALRVIPLLAGIGLLWVVYRLADALLGRLQALVALALSATAYPLMRYSVEVKPYIVDSLVSALLIWIAVRLAENLGDRRWWAWLAVAGSVGVLVSTPALLVCAGAGAGLTVAAVRSGRLHLLPRIALLGLLWGMIFGAAYVTWYAPNAGAPYMRAFWGATFLRPGTPNFLARLRVGLGELACTLTCWRGALDLWPMLLLLAVIGLVTVARRRGPEYATFLVGPILAAFGASMLGRYPIATRLVLFSGPLLAILVAIGGVAVATLIERTWPRIHARWILLLLVYPSLVLAATLAFAVPPDWGFRGVEVRPLAKIFRERGRGEPIYIFPRSVAAWVFHTTDWSAPDTARLEWVARVAGPTGPGSVNGASRGPRPLGDGIGLVYSYAGAEELYGTSTGAQGRMGAGYIPPEPDPGWAESEVWRMRTAARPYIWIIISDYAHGPLDERAILMKTVSAEAGEVVFTRATADAVLYRVRFPPKLKD
jgi:hypothetical protein